MAEPFEPTRHSPLSGLPPSRGVAEITERPYVGKVNLRGDGDDPAFRDAVAGRLGLELPTDPNTWRSSGGYTVYWLGPDEWLIYCADGAQSAAVGHLRQALVNVHSAVTDVSDYYLVIRLSGEKAREVLSKVTPLDIHHSVFTSGMCAQTIMGHASVLVGCMEDAPVFDIQVRWSFAEYLWELLRESTREYEHPAG